MKLIPGIGREFLPGALFDQRFEAAHQLPQSFGVNPGILDVFFAGKQFLFQTFNDNLKWFVILSRALLHAHHDVSVHLNKAAIAIPGEAFVVAHLGQREDGLVIQAEIKDCVHHAGHRITRTGTDRDE